jgi:hypothetical protein
LSTPQASQFLRLAQRLIGKPDSLNLFRCFRLIFSTPLFVVVALQLGSLQSFCFSIHHSFFVRKNSLRDPVRDRVFGFYTQLWNLEKRLFGQREGLLFNHSSNAVPINGAEQLKVRIE